MRSCRTCRVCLRAPAPQPTAMTRRTCAAGRPLALAATRPRRVAIRRLWCTRIATSIRSEGVLGARARMICMQCTIRTQKSSGIWSSRKVRRRRRGTHTAPSCGVTAFWSSADGTAHGTATTSIDSTSPLPPGKPAHQLVCRQNLRIVNPYEYNRARGGEVRHFGAEAAARQGSSKRGKNRGVHWRSLLGGFIEGVLFHSPIAHHNPPHPGMTTQHPTLLHYLNSDTNSMSDHNSIESDITTSITHT